MLQRLIGVLLPCFMCVLFVGCFIVYENDAEAQENTIEKKLEVWNLSDVKQACDGCDFKMREAISRNISKVDEQTVSLSRAQSGVKMYIFDNYSIEDAFLTLIDSNLFATRINRDFKIGLLNAIGSGAKDFVMEGGIDEIGISAMDKIEYAKRLRNKSEPKVIINSVNTMHTSRRDYRYSDSLEGYIVDTQIIILHFYSESQLWSR
ncbi:hypothetical protein DCO58_07720 [Helicobacter saguini]|uniref:Uncharacterized protein n=1 Tax=Helicobacter saguini TaxID=1548018 RepID=A0A347VX43_9HELI|nr:hypothetical protein [Helicobacter saguini]MWV61780.1 hypothetical protein [Helicobacter saguini]MWV67545.1 hypothetical protein [Helicobacter saguini]MWV69896.1 hypothetical protein [Helicobacter saguini]MWV72887.1 hypothetical protein [Helicobacter saguini]TLD93240.1 hypothetical protein LS64_008995 [Helicobacter saguini]